MKVIEVTAQAGTTVRCAKLGRVLVPLGKVERYPMGKIQRWDEDELRRLQALKQARRKEYDADPANEARLARLKRDKHNCQRSQEMFASIRSVGMTDSFEDIVKLVRALLAVGQEVIAGATDARPVEIEAPLGMLGIHSKWRSLPDGTRYLTTITLVPIPRAS